MLVRACDMASRRFISLYVASSSMELTHIMYSYFVYHNRLHYIYDPRCHLCKESAGFAISILCPGMV